MKRPGIGPASERPPQGGGGVTPSLHDQTLEQISRLCAEALQQRPDKGVLYGLIRDIQWLLTDVDPDSEPAELRNRIAAVRHFCEWTLADHGTAVDARTVLRMLSPGGGKDAS